MRITEFVREESTYRFAEETEQDCVTQLFNPVWLLQHKTMHATDLAGRASVHVFDHADKTLLLRQYRRGGVIRRITPDKYVWKSLVESRPWSEFSLLVELQKLKLPGPVPYGCCVTRSGRTYTGALITQLIPQTESLAQRLCHSEVSEPQWYSIGQTIRRFHDAGICHGDLNAHNILIDREDQIFLIDFDKSAIRNGHGRNGQGRSWKFANLKRLQRSIMKCRTQADVFFFSPQSWGTLRDGYLSRS